MQLSSGILNEYLFIAAEDAEVAVADDKDIVEEKCGQCIDGGGEDHGLHGGNEAGMPDQMQVDRFEQ